MSNTRRLLCVFYGFISLTALILTWGQNLTYFIGEHAAPDRMQYIYDLKANAAARSFTVDIGLFLLAGVALMVVEARKLGVKFVWLYVVFSFLIAISVTFPLFLIARELRLSRAGGEGVGVDLTVSDVIGLVITTLVVFAFAGFILT